MTQSKRCFKVISKERQYMIHELTLGCCTFRQV